MARSRTTALRPRARRSPTAFDYDAAEYEADQARVERAVGAFRDVDVDDARDDVGLVPTEFLAEDASATLQLNREPVPGPVARLIGGRAACSAAGRASHSSRRCGSPSAGSTSRSPTTCSASKTTHTSTATTRCSTCSRSPRDRSSTATTPPRAPAAARSRRADGVRRRRRAPPDHSGLPRAAAATAATCCGRRAARGGGGRGAARRLAARRGRRYARGAGCACAPFDSALTYLRPSLNASSGGGGGGAPRKIVFDGRDARDGSGGGGGGGVAPAEACAANTADATAELRAELSWLGANGHDGWFSNGLGSGAGGGLRSHGGARVRSLMGRGGGGGPFARRATEGGARRVRRPRCEHYGQRRRRRCDGVLRCGRRGGGGVAVASLVADLGCSPSPSRRSRCTCGATRGRGRSRSSRPFRSSSRAPHALFWIVGVVLGENPLSAFCITTLWVVTGVSADNIFVVHETWRQAHLLRVGNQRASVGARISWTVKQAAILSSSPTRRRRSRS